jgi:opacity protein-like surface antigen
MFARLVAAGLLGALSFAFAPQPAAAAAPPILTQTEPQPPAPQPGTSGGVAMYGGTTLGFTLPMTMHEQWSNPALGQSADLWEEVSRGRLTGIVSGFTPALLDGALAVELEQTKQAADVLTIRSPGFAAGKYTVAAFDAAAQDSSITFQSSFANVIFRLGSGQVQPYVGVGPGTTRSSINFNEPTLTNEGLGFVEAGETTGPSYQVVAGINLRLTARMTVGVDYRYFAVNPVFTWANGTQSTYDPRTQAWVFQVKYD